MNVKRLRAVAKRILKYPDTYDQETYIDHDSNVKRGKKPPGLCGTQACIAGHAMILNKKAAALKLKSKSIHWQAGKWLGLTKNQADRLFLHWPLSWDWTLIKAKGPKSRARVAAKFIEAFITTKGDFRDDE